MFKLSDKFSFLASFCTLYFLYNFCAVLCLAVEDYFGECIHPYFLFGDDYWATVGKMLCCGIFALYFQAAKTINSSHSSVLTQILHLCFVFVIIAHISQIVTNYCDARESWADFWMLLINISAFLLYFLTLSISEHFEDCKKRTYFLSGIFLSCFTCAFCLAGHYMPRAILKTLSQDRETILSVQKIVDAINKGVDTPPELPKNVQLKGENDKRIINYKIETDFELLKASRKYTQRLQKKFDVNADLFQDGKKVVRVILEKGAHKLDIDLPKRNSHAIANSG